ncbi:hypothetical protein LUX33_24540 [Actinomadura madurae]|uniref:hypothetical protein n=1 Tax=Actinomadura madurae TaxID=1993 RepID=UPI0020D22C94|nr:hypothetical protein [Actinomadura madurae]MCP9951276.1 hypothetical protein [Actinomadura madurae]
MVRLGDGEDGVREGQSEGNSDGNGEVGDGGRGGGRGLRLDDAVRVGFEVALDLGGGEAEAAEAQVVPALEAVGGAAEVEDGQLDGGGLLVFEAAEAGAAGGALDEEAGAGGEELGRAGVRVARRGRGG